MYVCNIGIINPRRACAARVTVVILCMCVFVCPYLRAHGSRPFLYAKQAHFPHSFRILRS